jgi:hypothetical protein
MTERKDLWLESQAQVRVDKWCDELGWSTRRYGWDVEITVAQYGHKIHVSPVRIQGTPSLWFVLPFGSFPDHFRGPWDNEALLFILRRNSDLAMMNWCITRGEGLAVQAYRSIDSLDTDGFRDVSKALVAELGDFMGLVAADCAGQTIVPAG